MRPAGAGVELQAVTMGQLHANPAVWSSSTSAGGEHAAIALFEEHMMRDVQQRQERRATCRGKRPSQKKTLPGQRMQGC